MQPNVSVMISAIKNKIIRFVLKRLDRIFDTDLIITYHNARIGFHTKSYRFKSSEFVLFIFLRQLALQLLLHSSF